MPVLFVAYWWVAVPAGGVRWADIPGWVLYPVVYFLYVMVRGALSGVYPYPFIDASALGYARSLGNAAGMLLGFAVVAVLLVALGGRKDAAMRSVRGGL